MIHSIESSLPSFKPVRMRPGLNLLLATRSRGATDRQTRNGAGKTSLVELVHFLLGAKAPRADLLRHEALVGQEFSMRLDLGGGPVEIRRSTDERSPIEIDGAGLIGWPVPPRIEKKTGRRVFSQEDWRVALGALMFGLPADKSSKPSFRMLFPYFARRDLDHGFEDFRRFGEKQSDGDQKIVLTYLLGLDTSLPIRMEETREREAALKKLRSEVTHGELAGLIGRAADLRTELTVLEDRVSRSGAELASFRVVPHFQELEAEASRITAQLAALSNEAQALEERVDHLRGAMESERPPIYADLEAAYREAGLVLPGVVRRRFDEVHAFHRSVVENRRTHLGDERHRAERRRADLEIERARLGERLREILEILRTGRALEQYTKFQEEHARLSARAEAVRQRLEVAEQVELRSAELQHDRASLYQRLVADHHEQRARISAAIRAFESLSRALYEQAGSLTIEPTPRGPQVDVRIQGKRSKGITKMQIFCFDMMLMELCHARGIGPGFLVHDSHIFDGVDSRQVAKAIELGAAQAEQLGFQYVVMLNEDQVPRDSFRPGFEAERYVLDVHLTDATEDGGLFGIRF
jgi:uncharacterized protein YydD (DUF2326 family)